MNQKTNPKKFLLVDDDQNFRESLAKAFERRGYVVETASCSDSAEQQIDTTNFDYAIFDLHLGEDSKDGLALLESLQSAQPKCQAIILTGYGTVATTVQALKSGAINFLTKPTTVEDILGAFNLLATSSSGVIERPTLLEVEWEHIQKVLKDCDGNISKSAKILGMHRRSLQRRLARGQ